jgi:long-chain acyl-CoA synthetase
VLLGENEPAWPMIYIGILLADATAVPVDPEMTDDSLMRIIRKSEAKVLVHHENYTKNTGDLPIVHLSISEAFKAEPLAENLIELRDRSNELASLLFTSGTTGDPKGVMLTHGNFCALVASLHGTFKVDQRDRFLSVLPLFHTFEFSCGFLLPISAGSQITYLGEIEGQRLRKAIQLFKPTVIIGVPALWDVLHKRIESQVKDKGLATEIAFKMSLKLNQQLRKQGMNAGNLLFGEIHRTLGGKIRHLISGGAALNEAVMNAFEGMGFDLLEGYGLTEAAPVLSVRRPNTQGTGTVGRPLPGVEIKIYQPNEGGVGEVIAKGDNVMKGYLKDDESTTATIKDGWLHTGDLGKIDKKGQLKLVGRRKEMIVTSSGKNVYPDELEPLFAEHDWIEELAIVGIPDVQGDEKVAALIVLKEGVPAEAQSAVKAHISKINAQRPDHQKLKTYRFWHGKLPRTSTRKVRRNEVKAELMRLLTLTSQGDESVHSNGAGTSTNSVVSTTSGGNHKSQYEPQWLYQNLALLLGLEISKLTPSAQLVSDLGISSLQMVELRLMIEENIQRPLLGEQFAKAQTIEDLVLLIAGKEDFDVQTETQDEKLAFWQDLPEVVQNLGQKAIDQGRKLIYDQLFDVDVLGKANIPYNEQLIVVSNHSSHLDVGLIKQALGSLGDQLCPLAAQDYFFSSEYKQAFFDQFTQLVPLDRTAPLEKSLQTAVDAISLGNSVLIYPEGTRSVDGQMQEFRPGVGYLQRRTKLAILPIYLRGPHRALPKGSVVPKSRKLLAKIGTPIWNHEIESWCAGKKDQEAYQLIANQLKIAIECLKESKAYPWQQSTVKTQVNGVAGIFDELPGRFLQDRVDKEISWYFSIGEGNEGRYVLKVSKNGMSLTQGKGQADCVLKTDEKIFEKIVREGYVPQPAEFIQGKIKTNDPQLLFAFKHVFGL